MQQFETTISSDGNKRVFGVNNAALHIATLRAKPRLLTKSMMKLYYCIAVATLNSCINGYDGSLMGSINSYRQYREYFGFDLDAGTPTTGIVYAIYTIGNIVGSFFAGPFTDFRGRRMGMAIGALWIIIGTVVQATCTNLGGFMAGRFLLGFGVATSATAGPAYVSEMAHPAYRGAMTGLYNVLWFGGGIPGTFIPWRTSFIDGTQSWRVPVWLQMVFSGLVLCLCFTIPESPRWLVSCNRHEAAIRVLAEYHGEGDRNSPIVQLEYREMVEDISNVGSDKRWWDYRELFNSRETRYRSMLVVFMAFFGQWSGNGPVSYYYPQMLQGAGISSNNTQLLLQGLQNVVQFSGAIFGALITDRIGRPTLEFYSTVSKEFSKKKLKLWRENDCEDAGDYAFGNRGLFPAPMSEEQLSSDLGKKQLQLFKTLGKFVARSMLDSRIIDISFNPAFFRIADASTAVAPSLGTVKAVDQDLAKSLLLLKRFADAKKTIEAKTLSKPQKSQALMAVEVDEVQVEDLGLDFTLPGYPAIDLIKNGSNIPVTMANVDLYVDRVVNMTLGSGVQAQVEAFRTGFSQVFPHSALQTFTPSELVMLFGRADEDWTIETLMDSIKADHGFNMDSRSVRNLLQTMSELDAQQRRDFLQFVTGSPKLPIGGFKSLTPIFTVVCRPSEPPYTPDDYLPSVMTCVNYLKLPDYSSLDILRERLSIAIKEGQGAFHLS
ncbi:hypothetical protein BDW59DRAFT_160131 [Aspergillus cavernicola]|uniref:Major facilitator superfamily (MFS) profile domain-containing protein n=1 Tax=Aspergillus cavernicola TaxID=176166 RepID=A0ABR4IJ77_9EURO